MPGSEGKRLLASLHDVGPGSVNRVETLVAILERHLEGPKFAMLVVPDHWHQHPLAGDRRFAAKLRRWSDLGIEMFVHGWFHRDLADHAGIAAIKARHLTAQEGEFLGLSQAEAARRMARGRALIEDITGKAVSGFIAPAWLYGPGARAALSASGYQLAEDHLRVWRPPTGEVVSRGPVITWASRSNLRTTSSLAFAAAARTALRPLRDVRLAVHPGDVTRPAILASIETTLRTFAARRAIGRYADLLPSSAPGAMRKNQARDV